MASSDFLAIGIDLGTTTCCVAYLDEHGVVEIIADPQGDKVTPSYVAKTEQGFTVGKIAKEDYIGHAVYDSKRLIGRNFDDPCIKNNLKNWLFKVESKNSMPVMELTVKNGEATFYRPEEVSAKLLEHMKQIAEEFFGKPVKNAIITVPAHFGYHQRIATREAAKLAGLNVLGMINEPTAASLAYIHKHKLKGPKDLLIFDLGGGTFDVSIVKLDQYNEDVRVIATAGNTFLGGRDFDTRLAELIYKKLQEMYGISVLSEQIRRRIQAAAENLKIKLSKTESSILELPNLCNGLDIELKITRKEFEDVNVSLFQAAMDTMKRCLKDAKMSEFQIDDVVLVGGSTKIPRIQQMLKEFFKKSLNKSINPDEAVAFGAAVQTGNYGTKREVAKVIDVVPLSLGIELEYGRMDILINRNRNIPVTITRPCHTGDDQQTDIAYNIYEGERPLVSENVLLGTCSVTFPPQPPGYPVDLTFEVDEDGIIHVSAREESGSHTQLSMEYKPPDAKKVDDIIQNAVINKQADKHKRNVLDNLSVLTSYCVKLKVVCDYDNKSVVENDKDKIYKQIKEVQLWIKLNSESSEIYKMEKEIQSKINLLETTCEPILLKYGYDIRNKTYPQFYQMIKAMQISRS